MSFLSVLVGGLGLLLLSAALLSRQMTIDLIVGKGDLQPGTNPTPLRDRALLGGIGLALVIGSLWLSSIR